jgi:hypothetical protein
MERTPEDRYTDLLRHLASPSTVDPEGLIESLREVERLHSKGHITDWHMQKARDAYASTIERHPEQGPTTGPGPLM